MNKYGSYCPHCGGDLTGIENIVPLDDGDMTYMEWPDLLWCRNCGTLVLLDGNSLRGWTPLVASVEGVDVHEMGDASGNGARNEHAAWEYTETYLYNLTIDLNELGRVGWELVALVNEEHKVPLALMKRRVDVAEAV